MKSFITRNKTAILATVAATGTAIGAYYYYNQLQQQQQRGKKNTINKDEKKDTKDSQKETEGAKKSTAPSNPPIYPVSSNGEPDFSNKANFTAEEKDKYALALKDKGNQFFRNKKYDDAIKYYNWALELKEDPVFYSNLSACYVSVGDLKKVVEMSTKALELKPDYSKVLLRRASANEGLGKFADAMFDLSVLSLNGDFNDASIEPMLERNLNKQAMSKLKEKFGDIDTATATPTELSTQPAKERKDKQENLPSVTSMASFFGIFKPELTFANYDESNEADKELMNGLSNLYKRSPESYDKADESFTKAARLFEEQLDKNNEDEKLKEKLAISLEHTGIFKFLKNDPLGAHEDIKKAIELFPRVNSYIYMALIMADRNDSTEYYNYFDKALKLDSNNSSVYYHRGQMNFILQNYDQAGTDFDKAKELDPENIFPYIQLACLAYRENKFDDCETLFSEAKRKFPEAPEVPNFFAEILTDKNDFDKALKQYDLAIELENKLDGIYVGIAPLVGKATLLTRNPTVENFIEATNLLEKASKLDPRSEQAKIGLAQMKLQQEDIDEAITLFEESADLARTMEEKLQAITFAEAAKVQQRIRSDPVLAKKIQETLAKLREQGLM